MNTAPYATPDGIRSYLASLAGLHALREDRRAAAARFERMPAYCILGSYLLTEDGRFGELTGVSARCKKGVAEVVAIEEFDRRGRLMYGERWAVSYLTPAPLAPYDELCPECGNGWTYFEHSDVVEARETRTFMVDAADGDDGGIAEILIACNMHVRCHEAVTARAVLRWAEDILTRSGFTDAWPVPCAKSEGGYGPWFCPTTAVGTVRFGRRGPGFAIDWSATGRDLMGAFCRIESMSRLGPIWNEPPVPHGPFHVDPKDESYLILYLDRLRQALNL